MARTARLFAFVGVLWVAAFLRIHALYEYPVGVSADEAVNVIDVFHIATTGSFPMYEEDEGRAEPLYRILHTAGALLWGTDVWTMRLVAAWLGVVTIATACWLVLEVLADLSPRARFLGALVAGVALAVMLGHMTLTRSLFRPNLQLLCVAMSAGFALRTLRLARWQDAVAWGVWGGLTLYTYTSAWIYPLAFVGLGVTLLISYRASWRVWLPRVAVATLCALVVAAPVLYLVVTYPRGVFGRAEAITSASPELLDMLQNVYYQFFVRGDENPQYNVAFAPLLSAFWQPLFVLGMGAVLIRIRTRASLFLLAMLVVFNIPSLASNQAVHGLRIAHQYIAVVVVIGVGVGVLVHLALKTTRQTQIGAGLVLGVLAVQAWGAWGIYQHYWEHPEEGLTWYIHEEQLDSNEWFFRTDHRDLAGWIVAQDAPLLVPTHALAFQTVRAWLIPHFPIVQSIDTPPALPTGTRLLLPYALELGDLWRDTRDYALLDGNTITLLPPLDDDTHARLLAGISNAQRLERDGRIALMGVVQPVPEGLTLAFAPLHGGDAPLARFGDELTIEGWYGTDTLTGQANATFTPLWSTARPRLGHEYAAYLQLQTQDYERLANAEGLLLRWLYPTSIWEAGGRVPTTFTLALPDELPAGAYRLVMGVYYARRPYLPAESTVAQSLPNSATIGWVKVPPASTPTVPSDLSTLDVQIGDHIALLAIEQDNTPSGLTVRLYWQARTHRPALDATLFVHVLDAGGAIVAQQDTRPHGGAYPTFIWDAGEVVMTEHVLGVPPPNYSLRLGMYTLPYMGNLPVMKDGALLPSATLVLAGE